jgi:RHS repeat-associated protein
MAEGGQPCIYSNNVTTYYNYSGDNILAEYDGSGALTNKYIYAGNERIAVRQNTGNKLLFYLKDHLGSSRVIVDTTGKITAKYNYYPFGDNLNSSVSQGSEYKYTGKELDEEGGFNLYYYGARYFDAKIGRFTSVDPLAEKSPGWSPYVYTEDNPLRFIDPTGEILLAAGDIEGFKRIVNEGLSGQKAETNNQGIVSLVSSGVQGPPSPGQQALTNLLSKVIKDSKTTQLNLVRDDPDMIDNFNTGKVDISDIEKFQGPAATAQGTLGHSIAEQYEKQVKGEGFDRAHEEAIKHENAINQSIRGKQGYNEFKDQHGTLLRITYDIAYKKGKQDYNVRLSHDITGAFDVSQTLKK